MENENITFESENVTRTLEVSDSDSFITLFGAIGARLLRNTPWLMPLPTLVLNILIVPQILKYGYGVPLPIPLSMLYIGIGAFIACYVLGMLLFGVLKQIAPYLEDRTVRAR